MVKVGADAGLAVFQQETVALVGGLRGAEAGDLAAGPEAAAVHIGVGAAGKGIFAGAAEVAVVVDAGGGFRAVDRLDRQAG